MKNLTSLIVLFILTTCSISLGQELPLEITGFGDVFYSIQQTANGSNNFRLGQVEIDIETTFDEKVLISAAIAYDPESETFDLGAFTIDLHIFGSDGPHFRRGGLDHSGMIIGQFDIPFGIDWQVYPSIDRKLISTPLVIENTHDAWNDCGVQGYVEHGSLGLALFATNGFGYEVGTDTTGNWLGYNGFGYDGEDLTVTMVDIEMKMAVGGRLGFQPSDLFEIGGSYATFINDDDNFDMSLFGADLQFNYDQFEFKGEYIIHGLGLSGDNDIQSTGLYAQGIYSIGSLFLVGRYGTFSSDINEINELSRFSAGAGWTILEGVELRVEHQFNSKEKDDLSFIQMVVGF